MRASRDPRPLAVPAGRVSRFARLGSTAAGIAGGMAIRAIEEVGRGNRPDARRLLLTPGNLDRVADELARMRGAAMKVGQLLSMDAGDVLPPELSGVMDRLRDQAHFMPPAQLKQVLNRNWESGWIGRFERFDVRPIAAASIGQVHHARLKDGREVAIKVQYPGVARSIDSDVANVAALVRMAGLLPRGFDAARFIEEARRQLHEETDYLREGAEMARFAALLKDADDFAVPRYHADWSTGEVLTMSFVAGAPIETAADAPRPERDRIARALVDLTLREVFEFGVTQSDPNFANYRWDAETGKIVLLDFGATRDLDPALVAGYRRLMRAGLAGDGDALRDAALEIGFIEGNGAFDERILGMIGTVFRATCEVKTFDFTDRGLSRRMNEQGRALAEAGYVPPDVPMDALYLQRKFGGMFLLCSRLRARLPLRPMLERYAA